MVVFLVIVFTWLTIQENIENEKERKTKLDYYGSLAKEVKTIIDRIKWDSLDYQTSNTDNSIGNDFLIVFKNDEETKLWKDIVNETDSLSTTDTSKLKTIVLIQPFETKVGTYQNGADAIRNDYKISFIEYPDFSVYYSHVLEGAQPPMSIKRRPGQDYSAGGRRPTSEMVMEYIMSIPKHE